MSYILKTFEMFIVVEYEITYRSLVKISSAQFVWVLKPQTESSYVKNTLFILLLCVSNEIFLF